MNKIKEIKRKKKERKDMKAREDIRKLKKK